MARRRPEFPVSHHPIAGRSTRDGNNPAHFDNRRYIDGSTNINEISRKYSNLQKNGLSALPGFVVSWYGNRDRAAWPDTGKRRRDFHDRLFDRMARRKERVAHATAAVEQRTDGSRNVGVIIGEW